MDRTAFASRRTGAPRGGIALSLFGIPLALACSAPGGTDKPPGQGDGAGGSGIAGAFGTGSTPGAGGAAPGAGGGILNVGGGGAGAGGDTAGAGGTGAGGIQIDPVDQPVVIEENPGALDPGTIAQLQGGGSPGGARLVYPYDGTIFPQGLVPPTLQWDPGAGDAVYLHMSSARFDYKGYFNANAIRQCNGTLGTTGSCGLPIPDVPWATAAAQSDGSHDPLVVELTVSIGGSVIGPMRQNLIFAPGKLKGNLYYNTYTSPQANNNGAVMRLHLGERQPAALLTLPGVAPFGPCWSCHSLSADGTMLVAQKHQYPGGPYVSSSFDVRANPNPDPNAPPLLQSAQGEMGLGAVYRDGSRVLTMGSPGAHDDPVYNPLVLFPDGPGNIPAMIGPKDSLLLDSRTGTALPMNGWTVRYAKMPSFSPDGTKVVFNQHEDGDGHSLAIADFDAANNAFSNIRRIYNHPTLYPGWPFITPDNQEVVFVLGTASDYVSSYPKFGGSREAPSASSLWTVNVGGGASNGHARPLARANGFLVDGQATYLPAAGRDAGFEYFPTMSPIAAGGYFWVFFTSRRTYGNTITLPVNRPETKKIWVTAFNIMPPGEILEDPSNPAFYLPGQEEAAGNVRAFAALEPCRAEGGDCETGVDCCGRSCWQNKCGQPPPPPPPPPGEPPPPPPCATIDQGCTTAADCCAGLRIECYNGFCSVREPR